MPVAEKTAAKAGAALAPAAATGNEIAEAAGVANASDAADGNGAQAAAGRVKASPLAKKTATAQGVDLGGLTGSGPGGRIIQRDVLGAASTAAAPQAAAPAPATAPASKPAAAPTIPAAAPKPPTPRVGAYPAQTETRTQLSGMRKTIAERLLASKTTIPHFYLHTEVDTAALTRLRGEVNKAGEKERHEGQRQRLHPQGRGPGARRRAQGQRLVRG